MEKYKFFLESAYIWIRAAWSARAVGNAACLLHACVAWSLPWAPRALGAARSAASAASALTAVGVITGTALSLACSSRGAAVSVVTRPRFSAKSGFEKETNKAWPLEAWKPNPLLALFLLSRKLPPTAWCKDLPGDYRMSTGLRQRHCRKLWKCFRVTLKSSALNIFIFKKILLGIFWVWAS